MKIYIICTILLLPFDTFCMRSEKNEYEDSTPTKVRRTNQMIVLHSLQDRRETDGSIHAHTNEPIELDNSQTIIDSTKIGRALLYRNQHNQRPVMDHD